MRQVDNLFSFTSWVKGMKMFGLSQELNQQYEVVPNYLSFML